MRTFNSPTELAGVVDTVLGHSDWHIVDQDRINGFAAATGDDQWIHIDAERAASGPFGTTIAHGYLTLSLIPVLVRDIFRVQGSRLAINYGLNKVRFPAPVPVGTAVRATVTVISVEEVTGGVQAISQVVVEAQGIDKPCCVAETVTRFILDEPGAAPAAAAEPPA